MPRSLSFDAGSASPGRRQRQGSPAPLAQRIKRAKTAHFDSDDEAEAKARASSSVVKGANGKVTGKVTPAVKLARKQEAERLLEGRKRLPVYEVRDEITKMVADNDTVIIIADTGSGKTTQIPNALMRSSTPCEAPRVVVTQPRRVAALSLAARVAAEVGCGVGGLVGYTIRFDDKSSKATRLKFATDGALLAEMLADRDLDRYDIVVLDEAHERSLRTDMLMGFLKDIQKRRREKYELWEKEVKGKGKEKGSDARDPSPLKIVVMSATIDAKRFSDFFNAAPVVYVKGRQFDVEVLYAEEAQADYQEAALKTIFQIHMKRPPGDVLVFLPGQDDIESLTASITTYMKDLATTYPSRGSLLICPLYAKLAPSEQAKAFAPAPPNTRKIILATNVAETSVTIPGIKYVVDSGMAKEKQYHAAVGIDSLVTESISQSSAMQRTGRAGREASGICFRLYTEKDFLELEKTTKPEIQRVSLTFAILHLLAAGQEDVWKFDFMDRPSKESITAALLTLHGLTAIDAKGRITSFGRQMASLPLEPVFARVLLSSFAEGCPSDIIDLLSLLGSRDNLLVNTVATRDAANLARKKFVHRTGDHMMLLNILKAFEDVEKDERKTWCKDNFVNLKAMNQVLQARVQLRERCERLKLDWEVSAGDDAEPVLNSLVSGLFANTALLQPDGSYRHTTSRRLINVHPGSTMHNKKVPAILYDELVLTTKTYARGVSSITPNSIRTKAPSVFGN
ncbi:P-loop containing nucleoside triphosphate hydrolase protein [Leucosporidium creatinivorum]|uniref:RNA helicase n=1 Tax=Leucosporidium creatinivorum TaxID=106004 RepID=A0A1Y2EXB3_9BASI|nr:P-loop containing nucleoside triphosphate hydrolase protein [Leucosporidium creatinivorum]